MTVSINEKAFQIILYGGNGRSSASKLSNVLRETLRSRNAYFRG